MAEPGDPATDLAVVRTRLESFSETIAEIKSSADNATQTSTAAAAAAQNATTKLEGDIQLLRQTVEQTLDTKAQRIRGDLWSELYQSTWKQVAAIAAILAVVSVAANAFIAWLLSDVS